MRNEREPTMRDFGVLADRLGSDMGRLLEHMGTLCANQQVILDAFNENQKLREQIDTCRELREYDQAELMRLRRELLGKQ